MRQQLSTGTDALFSKNALRKGRWRRELAAEIEIESEAAGRRSMENVFKGDECYGPSCGSGSSLEPELSEAASEDCRRLRAGSYHDGVVVRRGQLRERCTSAAGTRRDRTSRGWDRAAGQGSVSFVGRRAGRPCTERAEARSALASFESLFVRRECPDDRVRASFCQNLCHTHSARSSYNSLARPTHDVHGACGHVIHDAHLHGACGVLNSENSVGDTEAGRQRFCVHGETKSLSTSTRHGVRCSAVDESAHPQQTPLMLHVETWAGLLRNQGPKIFREVEIVPGCAVAVACPSRPDCSSEPPGRGGIIRIMLGWTLEEKTDESGVWLFRGALQGVNLFSPLDAIGDWESKGSYHTAWAVPCDSSCTCSYAYGQGPAIGPHSGKQCWPLLAGLWRAILPLMKPWCAEGEVPTAPNLNLYRRWKSCVGWHRDDEPLFGKCGDAKLIVSVSFGNSAVFRWRSQSCPDDEGHLCCLGHGDIFVMDGQCQDEFLHRTDPGREQERINITFRWVKQHVSSCPLFEAGVACGLPTCAQGSSVPVMGNAVLGVFLCFLVSS